MTETSDRFTALLHRDAYCQVPGCCHRAAYIRTVAAPSWHSVMHLCDKHATEGGRLSR